MSAPRPPLPWAGALALFALLACAYTGSIGLRASRSAAISGDEPFYLATTQSLIDDRNFDLREQYERESYRTFLDHPDGLWKQSLPDGEGRILSPHDPGLALLLVPGFAAGGLAGAQVELLLLAAATFALVFLLVAGECGHPRTAWLMTAAVGLTAPAFVYATEVYPELPGALCLVVALLALRRAAGWWRVLTILFALSALAWLGTKYVPLGLVVAGAYAWQAPRREALAFGALAAASAALFAWGHLALFGALTPYNGNLVYQGAPTASVVESHLAFEGRAYRLWGLFVDRRFGIGRWAPLMLAVLPALPFALRTPLGRVVAGLVVLQVCVASFVAVTIMGWWFPGRHLMVVYPLTPVVLTLAAGALPARLAAAWGVLALWSAAVTATLAAAGHMGAVRIAVDPFTLEGFAFRALGPAFPDYRWWSAETRLLNTAWLCLLVAGCAAAALAAFGGALPARLRPRTFTTGRARPRESRANG